MSIALKTLFDVFSSPRNKNAILFFIVIIQSKELLTFYPGRFRTDHRNTALSKKC